MAVKYTIETLTGQLLGRELIDMARLALRYSGTSGARGHPSTVRLQLRAVGNGKYLYTLTNECAAPRR